MDRVDALDRLAKRRIGYFATSSLEGIPHIVPITFTLIDSALVHMVDHKPKTTTNLRRVLNLAENPRGSLLVEHYEEDWRRLWWIRVDGPTTVFDSGPEWEMARGALAGKYPQYETAPPTGAAIYLAIQAVRSWEYNA